MGPMRLYAVFDDRYFMASTEPNVLNMLLLADREDREPIVLVPYERANASRTSRSMSSPQR